MNGNPSDLERVYGWWSFDRGSRALVDTQTGDRLRLMASMPDDAGLDLRRSTVVRWLRFEAKIGDLAYPLLVEVRFMPAALGERSHVWRVDHIRSAALAAREGIGSPHPSYRDWFLIDRFAIDALICWPDGTEAGRRPGTGVALRGGWRGTHWREDFFRLYATANTAAEPPAGRVPRSMPEEPLDWSFVPCAIPQSDGEMAAQLTALRSAGPSEVAGLLPALLRSRPHLVAGNRFLLPLATRPRGLMSTIWLYGDGEIISDRLQGRMPEPAPHWVAGWSFGIDVDCIVGTIDRLRGTYFDFPDHPRESRHRTEKGIHETGHLPGFVHQRFLDIAENAVWSWTATALDLPDLEGKRQQITVAPPGVSMANRAINYAGTRMTTYSSCSVSLTTPNPRSPHPLEASFSEVSPFAAETTVTPRLGWMAFDGAVRAMLNRHTGERLCFDKSLDGDGQFESDQVLLFRYDAPDMTYPIVIRRAGMSGKGRQRSTYWMIDLVASTEMRKRDGGAAHPTYGEWKRVSTFVFDAVMLWPETEYAGPALSGAQCVGGWLHGQWEPALHRKASVFAPSAAEPDHDSSLISLKAGPPPRWNSHRATSPARHPLPEIDLDPPDVKLVDPVDLERLANGMRGVRSIEVREDGGAILFHCGYRTAYHGGDRTPFQLPVFEYCDADVRVRLNVNRDGPSLGVLERPRLVRGSAFTANGAGQPRELFIRDREDGPWRPGPLLWDRLVDALKASLGRTAGQVTISGEYVADVWIGHHSQTFSIPKPGTAP